MRKTDLKIVPRVIEREVSGQPSRASAGVLRRLFLVADQWRGVRLDLDAHWHEHIIQHARMSDDWEVDALLGHYLLGAGVEARDLLHAFGVRRDTAPRRRMGGKGEGALFHPVGVAYGLIQLRRIGIDLDIDDFVLDVVREFPKGAVVDQHLHDVVWDYANGRRAREPFVIETSDTLGDFDPEASERIETSLGSVLELQCNSDRRPLRLVARRADAQVITGEPHARKGGAMRKGRHIEQVGAALRPRALVKQAKKIQARRSATKVA